jgi:cytidyltransferase-like protein
MKEKKVLVSGCYDLIHGGHVAFFKTAAHYGKLYVAVGTDSNLLLLKGKAPYYSQEERVFMVNSIRYVEKAFLATGSGMLDFEPDMERIKPDVFIVNSDGHTVEKEALCRKFGVEYKVLERIPEKGLPQRASSSIKRELQFPYRICIAGGWMDQPWVSEIYPGSVVVAQLWPTMEFNDRSGMATSSRKVALDIWGNRYPDGDPQKNAQLLFGAENPPGTQHVSGSQDHLGLLCPGINRLYYEGSYWPRKIDSTTDPVICEWLSRVMHLIPLEPRPLGYDPLLRKNLTLGLIKQLGESGDLCWKSILNRDVRGLGKAMKQSFEMWQMILPATVPEWVKKETEQYNDYPGFITSGCGGGYLIVASEKEVQGAVKIKIKI